MADKVTLDQLINPNATVAETTNALVAIDTEGLSAEAKDLLNQIIAEQDIEKAKDLTYLFNINQNKKTLVRIDKLGEVQDLLVAQLAKRVASRPDEISNQELMQAVRLIQEIMERGMKQATGTEEKPLITINQQTNNINTEETSGMDRASKDRVKRAVMNMLNSLKENAKDDPDVVDFTEDEDDDR